MGTIMLPVLVASSSMMTLVFSPAGGGAPALRGKAGGAPSCLGRHWAFWKLQELFLSKVLPLSKPTWRRFHCRRKGRSGEELSKDKQPSTYSPHLLLPAQRDLPPLSSNHAWTCWPTGWPTPYTTLYPCMQKHYNLLPQMYLVPHMYLVPYMYLVPQMYLPCETDRALLTHYRASDSGPAH